MGDMIDRRQARPVMRKAARRIGGHKIHVIDGLGAIAVNQIDHAAADAFDGGDVQLHRPHGIGERRGAARQQLAIRRARVRDPEGHGAGAGAVGGGEPGTMAARLGIDHEIGVALAVQRHLLGTMAAHGGKAHALEQTVQFCNVGGGIFDEFKAVGADGVVPQFHAGLPVARYSFICN